MNITYDNENPDQGNVKIGIARNMYGSISKTYFGLIGALNNLNL